VVDWSGHDGLGTSRRYRDMAQRQLHGISPCYELLCLGVADDDEMLARLDTVAPPKRQPNLLLAAVRYLDGPIDDYPQFRTFVLSRWDDVAALLQTRRTQTNEPRRCATLLPALAALPQPLALLEVGASAGLCLHPDRFAYRYDDRPVLGASSVVFDCRTSGPVPVPAALPSVVWRAGLDLNPLDVRSDDDVRWLSSLVWPEQTDRFATLRAAIEVARQDPVPVHRGDLLHDFVRLAKSAPTAATLVVFCSAVLAYLDVEQRAQFRRDVASVAAHRPTVELTNEGPGVVVDLPTPAGAVPFVLARDGVPLAEASPHGEWLRWFDASPVRG
jgi:hypothetical protein